MKTTRIMNYSILILLLLRVASPAQTQIICADSNGALQKLSFLKEAHDAKLISDDDYTDAKMKIVDSMLNGNASVQSSLPTNEALWKGDIRDDTKTVCGISFGPSLCETSTKDTICDGLYVWVDGYIRTIFSMHHARKSVFKIGYNNGENEVVSNGERLLIKWRDLSTKPQDGGWKWHIEIYPIKEK